MELEHYHPSEILAMHIRALYQRLTSSPQSLYRPLQTLMMALCVLMGWVGTASAQDPSVLMRIPSMLSPSAKISFIAAAPSDDEIYTVYGHAGLRVQDAQQGLDVVFNYGIFDFSEDFLLRYVQGKTDYIVLPMPTEAYRESYAGRELREVILATTSGQRSRMWALLLKNIQPENRVYRYNAFRNNCSTRPLDLYFETLSLPPDLQGTLDMVALHFDDQHSHYLRPTTWRQVINALEAGSPWLVLGTDLAMGSELDQTMHPLERLFIPTDAAEILATSSYGRMGATDTVWLKPCEQYIKTEGAPATPHGGFNFTHPLIAFSLLLILCLTIYALRARGWKIYGILEFLIYLVAGLGGCLLFYISFFSEHPMVFPNWNLLALHPGYLVLAVLMPFGSRTMQVRRIISMVLLIPLVAFPIVALSVGQVINPSVYLIAVSLFVLGLGRAGWFPSFLMPLPTLP